MPLPQVCLTLELHISEYSDYETSGPNKTGISVSTNNNTVNLMPGHIWNMARAAIMNCEHDKHELSQMQSDNTVFQVMTIRSVKQLCLPNHCLQLKLLTGLVDCMQMDIERGVISRRGSSFSGVTRRLYSQARALAHQPLLNDQARAFSCQPSTDDEARDTGMAQADTPAMATTAFTAPAVTAVATAVPTAAVSRMQPWENNSLARIPVAAQNSIVQPWAQSAFAQATAFPADSSRNQASQAQEHPMLDAASKKRSASGSFAEPTAKRWQIGAFQGGGIGNVSNNSSVWGAAIAAGLSEDGKHESEGSEMADGLSRLQSQHNGIRLKVKLSRAASVQKAEVMDESGDA